jgi:hypothetical protein
LIWNENLLCFINGSFKHYEIGSDLILIKYEIKVSGTNEANDHYCGNSTKITFMKSKKRLKMLPATMIFISIISLVVMKKYYLLISYKYKLLYLIKEK